MSSACFMSIAEQWQPQNSISSKKPIWQLLMWLGDMNVPEVNILWISMACIVLQQGLLSLGLMAFFRARKQINLFCQLRIRRSKLYVHEKYGDHLWWKMYFPHFILHLLIHLLVWHIFAMSKVSISQSIWPQNCLLCWENALNFHNITYTLFQISVKRTSQSRSLQHSALSF